MHADVLESEDAERGLDPFRLKIELPQVGENPAGFVSAFDAVSFVVPRDRGPRAVVASACETEEPLRHVPPTADSLMAFRVSEAKVMRVRRLGVDCVVPGRALRVQRPGETIVRLPPRKDGPPGGTDAAALQPPEAYRRGGSLEQRFPVRPRGDREDPHGEALLLGLQEVRVGIGPRGRLGPRELPPADGGRRRPAPADPAFRCALSGTRILDRREDGDLATASREAPAPLHRDLGRGGRAPEEERRRPDLFLRANRGGDDRLERQHLDDPDLAAAECVGVHGPRRAEHVPPTDVQERLGLLDVPKKLVLLAIARKSRKKAYITMGDAEEAYTVVCEEYDEKPRAHTQFWKYVRDLDALGLVDTKLSGEGVVGKTTLISLPEIPAKVLSDNLERSLKRR